MSTQAEKQFAKRIKSWKDAYCDDTTGIRRTLEDMLEEYAAFVMVSSIVRLASQRNRTDEDSINPMLFDLVATGYWSRLLLGVRRLLDKGPISGSKGVNSFRSLLSDVRVCRAQLNRRVYVEVLRQARYDVADLEAEDYASFKAGRSKAIWAHPARAESYAAHSTFDFLSDTNPENRSPDDLISEEVFERIENRVSALDKIAIHVDKHVAHSGTAESRKGHDLEDFDIRDAQATLRELTIIATFIGDFFTGGSGITLAALLGDRFDGLDKPLVETADLPKLRENWMAIDREVARWALEYKDL